MERDTNVINALGDAAQSLAREIAQCQAFAQRTLDLAWHTAPDRHEARANFLTQAQDVMRLSGELAVALAKLKGDGNLHRQHISVERIERGAEQAAPGVEEAPPPIAVGTVPTEIDPEEEARERDRAAAALAEYRAEMAARGRGEGSNPENESLR